MKKLFTLALLTLTISVGFAQKKKVAVVTFYADKMVDLSDMGLATLASIADLQNDPDFNLKPLLAKYHDRFFNTYAKQFPFEFVPEATVTGNTAYQAFKPAFLGIDQNMGLRFQPYDNYVAVDPTWNKKNLDAMLSLFPDADGIMFVYIKFALNKGYGIGGTATTKMQAYTHIVLYNKKGGKVFGINEHANSSKTGVMVGGVPVMSTDKILPMCESALDELMEDLDKRIDKIIKKSSQKL
jgi:hypothetical protein